jgi:hypothetical protein
LIEPRPAAAKTAVRATGSLHEIGLNPGTGKTTPELSPFQIRAGFALRRGACGNRSGPPGPVAADASRSEVGEDPAADQPPLGVVIRVRAPDMPVDDERPMMHEAMPVEVMPVPDVGPMEVVPVPEVRPVHETRSMEVRPAEMPAAAVESMEAATAAAMDLDGQIIGQDFRLRRSTRIHQRHGLRRDNRRCKGHQPRHGEKAEQSLHL